MTGRDVTLDVEQIKKLLPHRAPFLFVERLTDIVPGRKRHRLQGRVVQRTLFPGPFSRFRGDAGRADRRSDGADRGRAGRAFAGTDRARTASVYFMTIDKARFRRPVRPGDMLRMPVKALRRRGPVWKFAGEAFVGDELCAEAEFSAMIHDNAGLTMTVHPTAMVEDGARSRAGVEIGPYCVVGARAALCEGVRLHSHVVIRGHTEIGARTVVHPMPVLGGEAQMRKCKSAGMGLRSARTNIIRETVTISTGSAAGRGVTTIGERCYLMAGSHVGHDCVVQSGLLHLLVQRIARRAARAPVLARARRPGREAGGFVLGLALGLLYVPCAGPILAAHHGDRGDPSRGTDRGHPHGRVRRRNRGAAAGGRRRRRPARRPGLGHPPARAPDPPGGRGRARGPGRGHRRQRLRRPAARRPRLFRRAAGLGQDPR